MSESDKPRFTEKMAMHLNGGSKFSELHFDVYRDGIATHIKHFRRTNGSPKYLITDDMFGCGGDRFDNLKAKGQGLMEWLDAHSQPVQPAETKE